MKNQNNKTIRLSNFVLGEIYFKQNGKIKSKKINKVGYIITENEESYIYDLVDDIVIDLYNEELPDETQMFSIVNRPWENSNKLISHREVKEIIEILKKIGLNTDEISENAKYTRKEHNKIKINSEYEVMINRKKAHQKRLINSKIKKAYNSYIEV